MKEIQYLNLNSKNQKTYFIAELSEVPDKCPICHQAQEPRFIIAYSKPGSLEVI
jgi:hypothetical protein